MGKTREKVGRESLDAGRLSVGCWAGLQEVKGPHGKDAAMGSWV